jgi:hypothetical protein
MPHIEFTVIAPDTNATPSKSTNALTDVVWEALCNGSNGRTTTRAYDGTRVVVSTDPANMTVVVMRELRTCLMCEDNAVAMGDDMCASCREHMIEAQIHEGIMCRSCAIGDVCVTCDRDTTTCDTCRNACDLCNSSPRELTADGGDDVLCRSCREAIERDTMHALYGVWEEVVTNNPNITS